MSHPLRLAATVAALALFTAPASATTIIVSFSGQGLTVGASGENDGIASVTGSLTIDTTALPPNAGGGPDAFDYRTEGTRFFATSLSFSGDGRPSFAGDLLPVDQLRGAFDANGYYELSDQRVARLDAQRSESASLYLAYNLTPARQYVDGFVLPAFAVGQELDFSLENNSNDFDPAPTNARSILTQGSVRITAVTTGAAAPVPEPATWATMALGFGLAGAAVRRRRRAAAHA